MFSVGLAPPLQVTWRKPRDGKRKTELLLSPELLTFPPAAWASLKLHSRSSCGLGSTCSSSSETDLWSSFLTHPGSCPQGPLLPEAPLPPEAPPAPPVSSCPLRSPFPPSPSPPAWLSPPRGEWGSREVSAHLPTHGTHPAARPLPGAFPGPTPGSPILAFPSILAQWSGSWRERARAESGHPAVFADLREAARNPCGLEHVPTGAGPGVSVHRVP